jgi:hypothetical protein
MLTSVGNHYAILPQPSAYHAKRAIREPTLNFWSILWFRKDSTEVSAPKISLSSEIVIGLLLTDLQIHWVYVCQALDAKKIWDRKANAVPALVVKAQNFSLS